jgi:glycine oxidase
VEPVRGQALEVELELGSSPVLHFQVPGSDRPYYILPKGPERAWVGSTVERVGFDAGTSPSGVAELEGAVRELLPARELRVVRAWSGLRPRARRRGGPFLGPLPGREDVWVACGHYRSGIVLGPLSARLLAKQLLRRPVTRSEDGFDAAELRAFWPGA